MTRYFILLLFLVSSSFCVAQKELLKSVKFGRLSLDEYNVGPYKPDPGAHAVVLYDKGSFRNSDFTFTRHVRIKVFSHAGTQFGNFTIKAPARSFIKGVVFNLVNDELVETKLANDNIHTERIIEDFEVYKVFFPNVKPGSVIDLEYTHEGLPFEWRFQNIIPVAYSELALEPTQYVTFKKVFYGLEKITPVGSDRWVAIDVPALISEPHMSHYSNYLTRFEIEIEAIFYPRWLYREYSTSWQKVGERLLEFTDFGDILKGCGFLNEKAREIERSNASVEQKVTEAFKYIQANISWNGVNSVYVTRSYRENFQKYHSGNSAEINLLLITLLNKAGIKADPVVLSTRDNGVLNPLIASISKINYVVALVRIGDNSILLDATSPHTIPGVLPERCLNHNGWVVSKVAGEWIELNQGNAAVRKTFIRIFPDGDGLLQAEVSNTLEQYAYLDWVERLEKEGSEAEYARYMTSKMHDFQIENYTIKSNEREKLMANERYTFSLANTPYLEDLGNEFLINPFAIGTLSENPFKSDNRKFPVDLVCPQSKSVIISIVLPDGHRVTSLPESYKLATENRGAFVSLLYNLNGNSLSIRYDLMMNQIIYSEGDYSIIKNFYSELVRMLSQPIQIEKRT